MKRIVAALGFVLLLTGAGQAATISLPTATPINTGQDGNFFAYGLTILHSFDPSFVIPASSPGQIQDDLVIYTGTNNGPVNNNNSPQICGSGTNNCVDSPFQAPTGAGTTVFDMTAAVEPDPSPFGVQDRSGTWDITLGALKTFLTVGSETLSPIFLLQQNQENSGGATAQDIFGWGLVTISDSSDPTKNLFFEFGGPTRTGAQWNTPYTSDGVLTAPFVDRTHPGEFVFGPGQECLDAAGNDVACDGSQAFGPFNNNLGANEFAYGITSFSLNDVLASCFKDLVACGYDTMSVDFKLRELNNGFEQLIIRAGAAGPPVAEPTTLLWLGAGLVGIASAAWRRGRRN